MKDIKTFIGCSGFHYADWKKKFYPENLPKKNWLAYYTEHFNTVEINNTFYKMPGEKLFLDWKEKTPREFKFTIKANRYFTHQKKLNTDSDFQDSFYSFNDTLKALGTSLGCVLWQLPGNLHRNDQKLEDICKLLGKDNSHVFEFRHNSWFDQSVYEILEKYNVSFCMLSAPGKLPEDVRNTTETAYLRFHGKKTWYNYHYSDEELDNWKHKLKDLKNASELYVYFNNDHQAYAVENAKYFSKLFH
jgi:uncharacterized protein YecE (DUF72 family)